VHPEVELRLGERRPQRACGIAGRGANRDYEVDIVGGSRLALEAGGERPSEHVLDAGLVESRDD